MTGFAALGPVQRSADSSAPDLNESALKLEGVDGLTYPKT
jgi:hypothetical protein